MNRLGLDFLHRICQDDKFCLDFLTNSGIISKPSTCIRCFGPVSEKSSVHFKCTTKNCRKINCIFWNTPFAASKLKVNQAMELFFLFTHDAPSKFGKRKYHRGHRVEGVWVFGLVERTLERRLVVKVVEKRDAATLLPIIRGCVLPGSTVLTDCWRAYNGIESKLGLEHGTVNHSINYVDPLTLNHTNTIEGTWNGLKMKVPARKRTKKLIISELIRFSWNRKNKARKWEAFLEAFRRFNIE
mgnify:CR=1 FL=1